MVNDLASDSTNRGLHGGIGRHMGLKIPRPENGCASSSLAGGTNFYKIKILNPESPDTEENIRSLIGNWIDIYYEGLEGLGDRLKNEKLLESDLFFLKDFVADFYVMGKYRFKFERVKFS